MNKPQPVKRKANKPMSKEPIKEPSQEAKIKELKRLGVAILAGARWVVFTSESSPIGFARDYDSATNIANKHAEEYPEIMELCRVLVVALDDTFEIGIIDELNSLKAGLAKIVRKEAEDND